MLFSSKDLVTWKYDSLFTDRLRDGGWNYTTKNRVDCPDTYTLPDGRQVLLWLDHGGTRWNIGAVDNATMQFTAEHTGLEGHGTGVTQSVWDPQGRRVQIGWIGGTPFSAAQTLPHEIRLSASGDSFEWLPLPEMASLHEEYRTFSGSLQPPVAPRHSSTHALVNNSDTFGLHLHVQATFDFAVSACDNVSLGVTKSSAGLYIDVHCGDVMANLGVLCSLHPADDTGPSRLTDLKAETTTVPLPRPSAGPSFVVDVFVDSFVVEIFSGGAHVAHTVLNEIGGDNNQGMGVEVGVEGGQVEVAVDMWSMAPSISPPCDP